jgi:hypothetical protein
MYRYLGFGLIAATSTALSSTMTNRLLINKIPNEYYLGRDIPGQLIGLGVSLLLAHRFKQNPLRLGLITASLYPVGVSMDVIAGQVCEPIPYLTVGSILRSISYVGPAGAHTAAIVQICKHNNSNIFGTRNMVMGSLGATFGIIAGIYFGVDNSSPIILSLVYPISLYLGWRRLI